MCLPVDDVAAFLFLDCGFLHFLSELYFAPVERFQPVLTSSHSSGRTPPKRLPLTLHFLFIHQVAPTPRGHRGVSHQLPDGETQFTSAGAERRLKQMEQIESRSRKLTKPLPLPFSCLQPHFCHFSSCLHSLFEPPLSLEVVLSPLRGNHINSTQKQWLSFSNLHFHGRKSRRREPFSPRSTSESGNVASTLNKGGALTKSEQQLGGNERTSHVQGESDQIMRRTGFW